MKKNIKICGMQLTVLRMKSVTLSAFIKEKNLKKIKYPTPTLGRKRKKRKLNTK